MASITIRNLDDEVKARLRQRAASNGRSMEAEAREILAESLGAMGGVEELASAIHRRFAAFDVDHLPIPERRPARIPPSWTE
jgi:antitoxin FitA